MKRTFLLLLMAIFWSSSKGQSPSNAFKASKGTWHLPIANVRSVDSSMLDCVGGRTNSPYLTLKAQCAQEVRAIQSGQVWAVAKLGEIDMVMIKTGGYFLVYSGLTDIKIKKGDMVKQGGVIGTLAKGEHGETFELSLMLLSESETFNINRWFDWTAHNSSFAKVGLDY